MKSKGNNVWSWIFVVFCLIMALGMAGSNGLLGSMLMFLVAVMALPIKVIRNLWSRYLNIKPVEELSEGQSTKSSEQEKEENAESRAVEAKHQKRHNRMKPAIIAGGFFVAMAVGIATTDTSESENASSVVYDYDAAESEDYNELPGETEYSDLVSEAETIDTEQINEEAQTETSDDAAAEKSSETGEISSETVSVAYSAESVDLDNIPAYSDSPYVVINDNVPFFTEEDLTTTSYESYSDLDELGRCGVAVANIGQDIMPTEERGSIGSVKPTGWHTVKYDIVDGNYLYNRCHLIAYQLAGENANEKNLITGTRYLNVEGMLPFENMVTDYVEETNNHVLYRVTPIFEGDNLVASGVLMEAMSVEDEGEDILFNVYCYNVQPGIEIDYATGDSWLSSGSEGGTSEAESDDSKNTVNNDTSDSDADDSTSSDTTYILNTSTKKFHYPSCSSVDQMSEKNKQEYTGSREDLIAQDYEPCKNCNP